MSDLSYLLVLNTAEGLLQMAVGNQRQSAVLPSSGRKNQEQTGLLCSSEWLLPSQGVELLTPLLAATCERLHIKAKNITRIACVTGPGSFTGIRLAISSAAGLARATGALQGGIPFLPLLAANVQHIAPFLFVQPKTLWILTHARRDLVHAQSFLLHSTPYFSADSSPTKAHFLPAPLTDVLVLTLHEAVIKILQSPPSATVIAGSGLTRNNEALTRLLTTSAAQEKAEDNMLGNESLPTLPLLLPANFDTPHPSVLFDAAMAASYTPADIEPAYTRPCDAEENIDHIAELLGTNPAKTRSALASLTQAQPQPDADFGKQ